MNSAKLDDDLTLGKAFGALVAKECKGLQSALAAKKQRHDGIHRTRKSCRRLRCLLAFLPSSCAKQADALDRALRGLLHGFSELRDAHIAKRTAQLLASAHEAKLTPVLMRTLENHRTGLLHDALKDDPDWRRRRTKVDRMIERLQKLPWNDITSPRVKKVIRRSHKRVEKAEKKAMDERTPKSFHRWRKRARKLRYELELASKARKLAGMNKARSKRYQEQAKAWVLVTDRLGWRQDFRVFVELLDKLAEHSPDAAALSHALKRKSSELSKQAELAKPKAKSARAYVARNPPASQPH